MRHPPDFASGTTTRPLYDITKVLEVLGLINRLGRGTYAWAGTSQFAPAMDQIRPGCTWQARRRGECSQSSQLPAANPPIGLPANNPANRGEKSIRVLTRQFIAMYFETGEEVVSLDRAAKVFQSAHACR